MLERLKAIEADYAALEASLASPEVLGDQRKLKEASRRYKQQTPLVECIRRYRDALDTVEAAKELLQDAQGAEREQLQQELDSATESIGSLEEELKVLLLPPDPNDVRSDTAGRKRRVAFAMGPQVLVVGDDAVQVGQAFSVLAQGRKDSLATVDAYKAVVEQCGSQVPANAAPIRWFLDPL
ncbi:MAG: PCRF domain-containing protein, partial [Actinobacteria bacterium]|nr:PCRF domain-containing protein [Actinomycetota bacterium]